MRPLEALDLTPEDYLLGRRDSANYEPTLKPPQALCQRHNSDVKSQGERYW